MWSSQDRAVLWCARCVHLHAPRPLDTQCTKLKPAECRDPAKRLPGAAAKALPGRARISGSITACKAGPATGAASGPRLGAPRTPYGAETARPELATELASAALRAVVAAASSESSPTIASRAVQRACAPGWHRSIQFVYSRLSHRRCAVRARLKHLHHLEKRGGWSRHLEAAYWLRYHRLVAPVRVLRGGRELGSEVKGCRSCCRDKPRKERRN